jgi:hypothetical protein
MEKKGIKVSDLSFPRGLRGRTQARILAVFSRVVRVVASRAAERGGEGWNDGGGGGEGGKEGGEPVALRILQERRRRRVSLHIDPRVVDCETDEIRASISHRVRYL